MKSPLARVLHRSNNNPNRVWCWWDACGDFSSSMFFCLKYLPETMVGNWFRSVLAIKSPHWRAQILVWMVGVHDMLVGKINWPSELKIGARPSVGLGMVALLEARPGEEGCERRRHREFVPGRTSATRNPGPLCVRGLSLLSRRHVSRMVFGDFSISRIFLFWGMKILLAEIPTIFERLLTFAVFSRDGGGLPNGRELFFITNPPRFQAPLLGSQFPL